MFSVRIYKLPEVRLLQKLLHLLVLELDRCINSFMEDNPYQYDSEKKIQGKAWGIILLRIMMAVVFIVPFFLGLGFCTGGSEDPVIMIEQNLPSERPYYQSDDDGVYR